MNEVIKKVNLWTRKNKNQILLFINQKLKILTNSEETFSHMGFKQR